MEFLILMLAHYGPQPFIIIVPITGANNQRVKEDSPLIEHSQNRQQSESVELSPSPPTTSPGHVQHLPKGRSHLVGKKRNARDS